MAKTAVRHRPRPGELHDEPKWDRPVTDPADVRLSLALAYYNYVDMKDKEEKLKGWLLHYMETSGEFAEAEITLAKRVETWRVTSTVSTLSRIISNGAQLSRELVRKHHARIRHVMSEYLDHLPPRPRVGEGPTYDRARERERQSVALVEAEYDRFCEEEYRTKFSCYDLLVRHEVSKAHATAIADKFRPLLEELTEARAGKAKDLREAYSHVTRAVLSSCVDQVASIINDADRYALNKKAATVRKPRKKKEKAAAAVVSRVSYLREFPALKLVSVDPAQIVGAREVWLYSTKYKSLRRLTAAEGKSLTVSGSTVKGHSDLLSECRTLRKPEETLGHVLQGTVHTVKRVLTALTTKPGEVNGRINQDTVIVRVFK